MYRLPKLAGLFVLVAASAPLFAQSSQTLTSARADHKTQLSEQVSGSDKPETPPAELCSLIQYPTALGPMNAYLTNPDLRTSEAKSPAMIWLIGGFPCSDPGTTIWRQPDMQNDQSGSSYWREGMVTMFPMLRGTRGNPGQQESFYGEVDDILDALAYLKTLDHVDPTRIYLGGHSTGGTLALLVAEATDQFNAVISIAPVSDPADYGQDYLTYDISNEQERRLRAPGNFLDGIKSPTFVITGTLGSNFPDLQFMQSVTTNKQVHFLPIKGADHFNVNGPANGTIAGRLAKLASGEPVNILAGNIQMVFDIVRRTVVETKALYSLAEIRSLGVNFTRPQDTIHYLSSWTLDELKDTIATKLPSGWAMSGIETLEAEDGQPYYASIATKTLNLSDLNAVFEDVWTMSELALNTGVDYDGWEVQ